MTDPTKLVKLKFCPNCKQNFIKGNKLTCKKCELTNKCAKFYSYEFKAKCKGQRPEGGIIINLT
jgi:hypothetical protein